MSEPELSDTGKPTPAGAFPSGEQNNVPTDGPPMISVARLGEAGTIGEMVAAIVG